MGTSRYVGVTSVQGAFPSKTQVLVVGSGAAGLGAALTTAVSGARTLVIESGALFGGTSALSGGRVWLPPAPPDSGDHAGAVIEYLSKVLGTRHQPMIDAFVATARAMARFVEANSPHRFVACPSYPDYHLNLPGSLDGGRAYDAGPVSQDDLTPVASRILLAPGYRAITHAEWEDWRFPKSFDHKLIKDRARRGILTNGAALIAALIDGVIAAGASLVGNAALRSLESLPGDRYRAIIAYDGRDRALEADAVVLATGGFDAQHALRARFLPTSLELSAAAPTNTGIAIEVADDLDLVVANMGEGWWMPMVEIAGETVLDQPYPRALIRERGLPHLIAVDHNGRRFVDEAAPYHEFTTAMLRRGSAGPEQSFWLVFDHRYLSRYSFPGVKSQGDLPAHMITAGSVELLAARMGIAGESLQRTVGRWNQMCVSGRDADFGRGDDLYDRYYGDPTLSGNPNLGSIETPPLYACRVRSATVGSKGGPVTTIDGEAVATGGNTRRGLYVVGNAGAFWTGSGYPGPGSTLGFGMTFAYRAGRSIVKQLRRVA